MTAGTIILHRYCTFLMIALKYNISMNKNYGFSTIMKIDLMVLDNNLQHKAIT